ncbi:MAG: hypothetical protein ACI38Q_02515 [Candidatus Bruticola sp.]
MLKERKKGIVLITTMLAVVLVMMLLSSVVYSNLGSLRMTNNFYDKENALMAAHSGAQYAITRLQSNILWKGNPSSPYELKVNNFEVKEKEGNVWGIVTSVSGKKSVFRIKFNCEDGDDGLDGMKNSANKIESPYISTNNLFNTVPRFAYPADKNGVVMGKHVTSNGKTVFTPNENVQAVTIPKATCNLIVEGFSGEAVRDATLDNPINEDSGYTQQVLELYVSLDPDFLNSDSVVSAAGDITAKVESFSLISSDGSAAPNMRSLGKINLKVGKNDDNFKIENGATVYYGDSFKVNSKKPQTVKSEQSSSGKNFTALSWEDIPRATEKDTKLSAGTYVWVRNSSGKNELHHYPGEIYPYGKTLPDSGYEIIGNTTTNMTVDNDNLAIMFDRNMYVEGDLLIRSDINEYGTRPIVGFSSKNQGDNNTTILTGTGNITISGATIGNGAITAEGNISIQGPSILESDPGVGVSIYAKGDVNLETIYNTTAHMEEVSPTPNKDTNKPYDNVTIDPDTGVAHEKPVLVEAVSSDDLDIADLKNSGVPIIHGCSSCINGGRAYCSSEKSTSGITGFINTEKGRALMAQVYSEGMLGQDTLSNYIANDPKVVMCSCDTYEYRFDWRIGIYTVCIPAENHNTSTCEFYQAIKKLYNAGKAAAQTKIEEGSSSNQEMASITNVNMSDKFVPPAEQTENYETYKTQQLAGLLSRYQSINYSDQEIAGVIYACGNINVDIGKDSRLNLTGSMVAYGKDPQADGEATKTDDKGNISYKAKSVEMTFDPSYINKLLATSAHRKVMVKMFANY